MNAARRTLSPVGMSAAEYAATHDIAERLGLFEEILVIDPSVAIELANEKGWWASLDQTVGPQILPENVAYRAAQILGKTAPTYHNLFRSIVSSIPSHIAFLFSQGSYDDHARDAWTTIKLYFDRLPYDDALSLIGSLLTKNVISSHEAVLLFDSVPAPLKKSQFEYAYSLYALLPVILERLNPRDAKEFFGRTMNNFAIAHSSAAFNSEQMSTVVGADSSIYRSATIVSDKLSRVQAIAWTTRVLIECYIADYADFDGSEPSGPGHSQIGNQYSYQDNGWLLKIIVPLLKVHFDGFSEKQLKQMIRDLPHSVSVLHPAFRIRAVILAFPQAHLGTFATELVRLCEIAAGIPSISDSVANRALEDQRLAEAYLVWAWSKHNMLYQPDEAKLLHSLIIPSEHKEFARALARQLVSSNYFAQVEPLQLGFFNQMQWANEDRQFALELIVRALRSGYSPGLWDSGYIVALLKDILVDETIKQEALAIRELRPYLAEAISSEDFRDVEIAKRIFTEANKSTKVNLLQKAGEWSSELATPLIRLGLQDADPTLDSEVERRFREGDTSSITGVRITAYWTLIRQIQNGELGLSQIFDFGIFEVVSSERGAYGAHHGLILLQAIMKVALRESAFEAGAHAVDVAIGFLSLNDERIDEQVAGLIIWWWPKLDESYRDVLRVRLGNTEVFLNTLMGHALFKNDEQAAADFLKVISDVTPKRKSWASWNLWRSMHMDGAPTLKSPIVQSFVDRLASETLSEVYLSLTRLLAERQTEDQNFATSRFLKILTKSIEAGLVFPAPFDLQLLLGDAKEDLVALLDVLAASEAANFGPFVNIALSLLLQMNDEQFNPRAQAAIDRFPSSVDYDGKRQRWRRIISQ